ncbi:MAG: TonB-dependent receptor [Pseudomonadota bacterium]|nr:TonB-dependent receptor [Pseudomonadota bacterium]
MSYRQHPLSTLWLLSLLNLFSLPLTAAPACQPPARYIELPAGSLAAALRHTATQFDYLIVMPALPGDTDSGALQGCGTLDDWLQQLLRQHPLDYRIIGDSIAIYPQPPGPADEPAAPPGAAMEELLVTSAAPARYISRRLDNLSGPAGFSVDASTLRRSGIYTLSSALELAAGVKVEDNRYAIIRGMSGRYQSIRMNGGELPSLDPAAQNFPLDFIPIGILNSIDLRKSVYADAPGQASAGIVSLNTMQLPDNGYAQLAISAIWRPHSNNSQVLQGYVSDSDWYGYDDGSRRIPPALLDNAHKGGVDTLSAEQREQLGEAVVGDMGLYQAHSGNSGGLDLSTGSGGSYQDVDWGGTLSVSLRDRWQQTFIRSTSYSTGTGYSGASSDFHHEDSQHQRSEHITGINTLAALGLSIADKHYLGFNTLYLHQATHRGELVTTQGKNENDIATATAYRRNLIQWTERSLLQRQLYGQHTLSDTTTADWQASRTVTGYDRPHELDYRYFATDDSNDYQLQLSPSTTSIGWRYMQQQTTSVSLSLSHLYAIRSGSSLLTGEIKTGWESSLKQRDGYNLLYGFSGSDDLTSNEQIMELTNPSDILTSARITGDSELSGFILQDTLLDAGQDVGLNGHFYTARQNNRAAYLLNDIDLSDRWRLISGLRHERNRMQAELWDAAAEPCQTLDNSNRWLPSIAAGYLPSPHHVWLNYRHTVAWPEFNEVLPVVYEDLGTRTHTTGNPELLGSDVHNWDLSWQWQNSDNMRLATSFFLKRIRNPIEGTFTDDSETTDSATYSNYTYRNSHFGQVQGMELEADYSLYPGKAQRLNFSARYARIRSHITNNDTPGDDRPLQGQPAYISAARMQYMPGERNTFSLIYKRSGTQLYIVSDKDDLPSVYQQPRNHLDFSWTRNNGPLRVSLSVNNLLNTAYRYTQGSYNYLSYRSGREWRLALDLGF